MITSHIVAWRYGKLSALRQHGEIPCLYIWLISLYTFSWTSSYNIMYSMNQVRTVVLVSVPARITFNIKNFTSSLSPMSLSRCLSFSFSYAFRSASVMSRITPFLYVSRWWSRCKPKNSSLVVITSLKVLVNSGERYFKKGKNWKTVPWRPRSRILRPKSASFFMVVSPNWYLNKMKRTFCSTELYKWFSSDITAAIFVSQNNEMANIFVSQMNSMGL